VGLIGLDSAAMTLPKWRSCVIAGSMLLAEKTRFGPYEIISLLGAGGMGEVYQARDTRLDRTVAIKICKGRFTERFEREARAISSLNHPHICALYDIGREDSVEFLVMEYLEGESLEARLRKGARRSKKRSALLSRSLVLSMPRTAKAWSTATSSQAMSC
jgi:serine/threonine protein kinase